MVAGPVKTGAGRAFTFQLAHLSELAFWKQASDHMSALMRTIHKVDGTEIIMESTASGATGVFHANAMAAQAGHGDFELLFFPGSTTMPTAPIPPPTGGPTTPSAKWASASAWAAIRCIGRRSRTPRWRSTTANRWMKYAGASSRSFPPPSPRRSGPGARAATSRDRWSRRPASG